MPRLRNSPRQSEKNNSTADTAIKVAVITLIGTIITVVFSSPVLLALVQKSPTPTETVFPENYATFAPLPTNPPVSIFLPNPDEISQTPTIPPTQNTASPFAKNTVTETPALMSITPQRDLTE